MQPTTSAVEVIYTKRFSCFTLISSQVEFLSNQQPVWINVQRSKSENTSIPILGFLFQTAKS